MVLVWCLGAAAGIARGAAPSTPGRVKSIWPEPALVAAQRTSRGIPKE